MQSRLLIISICPTKILFLIIVVLMYEKKPGCIVCRATPLLVSVIAKIFKCFYATESFTLLRRCF